MTFSQIDAEHRLHVRHVVIVFVVFWPLPSIANLCGNSTALRIDCLRCSLPTMPTRVTRRLRRKTSRKKLMVANANARMKARRTAIRALNTLITDLGLPLPHLKRRRVNMTVLPKVLRVLSKRCVEGAECGRFGAALRMYTGHGLSKQTCAGIRGHACQRATVAST